MDCDEFDALWARAAGRCEICRVVWRFVVQQRLDIDHDPRKGDWAVRGLLCSRCNTGLGTPGQMVGPEVDAYLANPWRTKPPVTATARPSLSLVAELKSVAATYRREIEGMDRLRPTLYRGIYDCWQRGDRPTDLVAATGLTRERIRQIIAVEEKRRQGSASDA
jgi:hypothetical protein